MKKGCITCLLLICAGFLMSIDQSSKKEFNYPEHLSEFGFFTGPIKDQIPAADVVPYALNSPLFSDYAYKLRFIRLPKGTQVAYRSDEVLNFPVGTSIVKTFYYKNDEQQEKKGRRIIETRVLIHEAKGWVALPYIWNEAQTEATLEVAGGTQMVAWKDKEGQKKSLEYFIPNMNQCKGCHEKNGIMTPIGPSARQLNGEFNYGNQVQENQLAHWKNRGMIESLPEAKDIPKMPNYSDISVGLADRAKAYLDVNCAHCHNPKGPAQSSGLFLHWNNTDPTSLGIMKSPVAAGRGSGNFAHDIVPGKPEISILHYRMASTDPGVMMPELGRRLAHKEGIDLIEKWIKSM